eukprot:scaffold20181_cov109-Skeletonema_marinoi.AAC.3
MALIHGYSNININTEEVIHGLLCISAMFGAILNFLHAFDADKSCSNFAEVLFPLGWRSLLGSKFHGDRLGTCTCLEWVSERDLGYLRLQAASLQQQT